MKNLDVGAIVLMYEDINLVDERLIYRGSQSELEELVGNVDVLRESGGTFKIPVDGVNRELRIEKTITDYEGTDKLKYICYKVVPNN